MKLLGIHVSLFLSLVISAAAFADEVPPCMGTGYELPVNNRQVLHWKRTTENQFRERAHVQGEIVEIYPDRNGHEHFVIALGRDQEDVLEVIYNQEFGALPELETGMVVEACGDYITSTAPSGPYPASPVGAIIHWVHFNPSNRGHESGFLVIDGKLYGTDVDNAGPGRRRDRRGGRHGMRDAESFYRIAQ
jgi:hypothetical protein